MTSSYRWSISVLEMVLVIGVMLFIIAIGRNALKAFSNHE
jgi:hypothetical protein